MAPWLCEVNIKKHLTEGEDPETVKRAALAIADELEKAEDQDDVLALLACMGLPKFAKALRKAGGDLHKVNAVLSALYDYGDRNRIWFGLR